MAHDLVLKGGTVVDGTRSPAHGADVAIDGERITAVGKVDASGAKRVIDADGALVTPGFVDLQSHLVPRSAGIPPCRRHVGTVSHRL